jgi:hypothetical protein
VLAGKDTAPIFIENGRFHGERIVKVLGERQQEANLKGRSTYG